MADNSALETRVNQGETGVSPWLIALGLACVPAIVVGCGRFAYGIVLPAMKTELGLTFAQMGALNTANALGYLGGALSCAPLTGRVSERQMIVWSLLISIIALAATGLARSYDALLICRIVVGVSAAFGFIAATGLAARLKNLTSAQSALALGIVTGGPSVGVFLSGATLPLLLGNSPAKWPFAWEAMAALGALALPFILWTLRHAPPALPAAKSQSRTQPRPRFGSIWPALVTYFLFGLGYISYMTFLGAYIKNLGATPTMVALVWATLGFGMFSASFVWRARLGRERGGKALFLLGTIGGLSAILPLFSPSMAVMLISVLGFGMTTMAVYTAVIIVLRLHWDRALWTLGVAYATVILALGQSIGPYGSGLASDAFGPKASLIWSGTILIVAGIVALLQKPAIDSADAVS